MTINRAFLKDVLIIQPKIFGDNRGFFTETYREDKLEQYLGHKVNFCQDNLSKSVYGVLRGLHYQLPPYAQTKLVSVIQGKVLDVAVDIREGSPTFGQYVAEVLSAENKKQMFIPRGFAHGFVVLSEEAAFSYKVDNYYNKSSERGITHKDKSIDIDWVLKDTDLVLSEKDKLQPDLNAAELFSFKDDLYE